MNAQSAPNQYVVLIYDRDYLQPRRKLGPITTARTFPDVESALRAGAAYLRRKASGTAEAISLARVK